MYGYGCFISANGKPVSSGVALTARTTAFATATGITDVTILNALNTFDLGLIGNGLETKMKALYPFVGGTSTTNSYNFMNTSQYQITWYGGMTHNANGITGNGSNAYGDTNFSCSNFTANNNHISVYLRTNNTSTVVDISSGVNGSPTIQTNISGTTYVNSGGSGYYTFLDGDSLGLRLVQINGTNIKSFKNNILKTNNTYSGATSNDAGNMLIGRFTTGSYYTNRNMAFVSLGTSMSDSEQSTLYSLIQTLQTSLNRQV